MNKIPRLVIGATQSGSGKTTVTAGIIAALKMRGLKVQAYKVGPDYIDPGFHEIASGRPAHNLDAWLVGREKLGEIFFTTSRASDIAIVEGVMGLYDGGRGGISSTADIAKILDAPVILIIDAKSMGASAAAIALGFREFDRSINFAGVILNRIGSDSHEKMIRDELDKLGIKCFGAVKRDPEFIFPERHLGLVPTEENNFAGAIKNIGEKISRQINLDAIINSANDAPDFNFNLTATKKNSPLCKIAVARDKAFGFYYEESLNELKKFGAEIVFFSPLEDESLPENISGLILGGGFPEIFAAKLEENKKIRAEIKSAAEKNLPIFAECGGFMYLMKTLKNFDGKIFEMCGVIPGGAEMTEKLQTVGYVEATLTGDCVIGRAGDKIRTHEFHFSREIESSGGEKIFDCEKLRTGKKYFAGFAGKNIVASYLHIHFAGQSGAAKNFVNACINFSEGRCFE